MEGNVEQQKSTNLVFVPENKDTKETPKNVESKNSNLRFVPSEQQPDLKKIKTYGRTNDGGFMQRFAKLVGDVAEFNVGLQMKTDIAEGAMIEGGLKGGVSMATTYVPDIVANVTQVAGDLTNTKSLYDFGSSIKRATGSINSLLEKDWIQDDMPMLPTIKNASRALSGGGTQAVLVSGIAKPLGMVGAYLFQSAGEGAGTYVEAREAGKGKGVASAAGLGVMASNYAIDRFADPLFLAKGMKKTARGVSDFLLDVSKEPGTEMLQQVPQNFIAKLTYDENRGYLDGIIEAGIGGLGGGIAAVSFNGITYNPQDNYEKSRSLALSKGVTQEELARFESVVIDELQRNNGKISEFLTGTIEENLKNATEFYNSIPAEVNYQTVENTMKTAEQFIAENEGTEEANRIRSFKTELENVYTDSLEMLKGKMSDAEAEASAKILQGRALFGSQLFGVSPTEYMKTIFPSVQKTTELDFLQKASEFKGKPRTYKEVKQEQTEKLKGIAERIAKDIQATYGDRYLLDFSYLSKLIEDYSDLYETSMRGNIQRYDDNEIYGAKGTDINAPDIGEVLSDFGKEIAYEPGVYKDYAQIGYDEFMNLVKDEFEKGLDRGDMFLFQTEQMDYDSLFPEYTGETITVDGKERPVYNSEGNRIAKSKEALINFYKWFGDSKVVDGQGRPKVMKHWTPFDFSVFKIPQHDIGFHVGTEEQSKIIERIDTRKGKTLNLYVRAENSLEMSDTGYWSATKYFLDELVKSGVLDEAEAQSLFVSDEDLNIKNEKIRTKLREKGYDSIKYINEHEYDGEYSYLLIDKNQVKETTNKGYFSKTNDDIYYQPAYTSMKADEIVGEFLDWESFAGTGEGYFAHGVGNYALKDRETNKTNYYDWMSIKGISFDGKKQDFENNKIWRVLLKILSTTPNKEEARSKALSYLNESMEQNKGHLLFIGEELDRIKNAIAEEDLDLYERLEKERRSISLFKKEGRTRGVVSKEQKAIVLKYGEDSESTFREYVGLLSQNDEYVSENEQMLDIKNAIEEDFNRLEIIRGGSQYEIDVPADKFLLDEDKSLNKQSVHVRKAIRNLMNSLPDYYISGADINNLGEGLNGESFYSELGKIYLRENPTATLFEQKVYATKKLREFGVKGIKYDGGIDGVGYVIFSGKDSPILRKLLQEQGGFVRGAFDPALNTIFLFSKANRSTFMHETAHGFIRELNMLKDKSEIARSMLSHIDNWATEEFNKRYSLELKDGSYVVKNRAGLVEYDKGGAGFGRKQDAIDYAKNELFARGFEQYLRDGKAPSNYLKRAFNSFMNWLKRIYQDARELNVSINEEIRQVYSEMLGGENLDFWMSQPVENIIEAHKQTREERNAFVDEIIKDTIDAGGSDLSEPKGRGFSTIWTNIAIPLSTRAERISPKVKTRLRRFEYELRQGLKQKYEKSKPFIDIWNEMSFNDSVAFDLALKNDYAEKVEEIVAKYNASEQWQAIRDVLSSVYNEAQSVGLDLGFREEYFPRKVRDVDGFMSYLHNTDEWSYFEQALREADPDNVFTVEEKADFLNKFLRGYVKSDLLPNKYSSEKHRKIQTITRELNRYYSPSLVAYTSYLDGMNTRIESAKFLGKDADNLEESIGGYLTYLINNNIIKPSDVDEVKDILRSRLNQKGVSNKWLGDLRNISYMYTMGGVNSAITQIEDLSTSLYKAGVWNTLSTMFSGKQIKKSDLATDNVSVELSEPSRTAKYLNNLFKATGLTSIDTFAEEVLTNATFKKYRALAEKDVERLKSFVEPVMEEETEQTIQDIKDGNITDNVKFLMFNAVSDVKPVSLSELPAYYNTSGNMRVAYMLKSFAIKRIDIFRNECFDKLRSNDFETRKQGLQNLFKLSVLMVICGATKDWIIDLLYGRKTDVSERLLNNIISLSGLSKYHIYKTKEQGFTGTLKEIVVPPIFSFFDDLFTDVAKSSQGKRDFKDYEVLKGIPLVGRFYYWHIGRGKEKQKKKRGSRR